jgi:hypothetical protein
MLVFRWPQITFLLRKKTQCDEKYIADAKQRARAFANKAESFLAGVSSRTYSLTGPCIDAAIRVSAGYSDSTLGLNSKPC